MPSHHLISSEVDIKGLAAPNGHHDRREHAGGSEIAEKQHAHSKRSFRVSEVMPNGPNKKHANETSGGICDVGSRCLSVSRETANEEDALQTDKR